MYYILLRDISYEQIPSLSVAETVCQVNTLMLYKYISIHLLKKKNQFKNMGTGCHFSPQNYLSLYFRWSRTVSFLREWMRAMWCVVLPWKAQWHIKFLSEGDHGLTDALFKPCRRARPRIASHVGRQLDLVHGHSSHIMWASVHGHSLA